MLKNSGGKKGKERTSGQPERGEVSMARVLEAQGIESQGQVGSPRVGKATGSDLGWPTKAETDNVTAGERRMVEIAQTARGASMLILAEARASGFMTRVNGIWDLAPGSKELAKFLNAEIAALKAVKLERRSKPVQSLEDYIAEKYAAADEEAEDGEEEAEAAPHVIEFATDSQLLNLSLSEPQEVLLRAIDGLPLSKHQRDIFRACTGRRSHKERPSRSREACILCGARGGKTGRIAAGAAATARRQDTG